MTQAGRIAPAAARNREPIFAVLRRVLPERGTVLEIASGSGEHALWFSAALPHLDWQPSDRDPEALGSIEAWRTQGSTNFLSPVLLDAAGAQWPVNEADAVVSINMIHIAPWSAAAGLLAGCGRMLSQGGPLCLYGPFREGLAPLASSNVAFDADLRARDATWGLRDTSDVTRLAADHGLTLMERVAMPANNLMLVFRKG